MVARVASLFAALLLCAPTSAAPAEDADDAPAVLVQITPPTVPQGATVTIGGSAYATEPGSYSITVTLPNGSAEPVKATILSNGGYQAVFRDTKQAGNYGVRVEVKGAKLPGTGQFTVLRPADYGSAVGQAFAGYLKKAAIAQQIVSKAYAALPDSPAKRQLQSQVDDFNRTAKKLADDPALLNDTLKSLNQLRPQMPATLAALDRRLLTLERDSRPDLDDLDKGFDQLQADNTKGNVICEQIEVVKEGINWMSVLFKVIGGPVSMIQSFATDAVASKAGSLTENASDSLIVGDITKELVKKSPMAEKILLDTARGARLATFKSMATTDIPKLATAVSGYIAQGVFKEYCQQFEGPFSATMEARIYGGETRDLWWVYEAKIEGTLTLRYPKNAGSGPIAINGEFMGQATRLKVTYENAIFVLFPKMGHTGSIIKKFVIDPVTLPISVRPEFKGKVLAHTVTPYSFKVPVKGTLADGQLSLQLGEAISDYDAHTRVVYLIDSPLALLPVLTAATFPYKDAHFILMRAMKGESADFQVTTDKNQMSFTEDFSDDRRSSATEGKYQLHIKACNPGCK